MQFDRDYYVARAKELFFQGYNCAQAVAGAFYKELGLSLDTVARMTYGLGGGVGRLREICGTVSGMAVVIGAMEKDASPNLEIKKSVYEKIQWCADRFREANGSIVCKELLGMGRTTHIPEERTEAYYKKRPCPELIGMSAGILYDCLVTDGNQNL